MEQMFIANDLVYRGREETVDIFVCGRETYLRHSERSLLSPDRPATKTLVELTAVLTKDFSPPPSEVIQQFRFYSRVRQPGELVSAFVAAVRELIKYCNFGDSLDKALRDRIVGGINHEAMQKKLLSERDLTYERAVEIVQGVETSDANLREMTTPLKPVTVKTEPVYKVAQERDSGAQAAKTPVSCPRCGTEGHSGSVRRFKDKHCNFCKKKGHIARMCRKRLQQASPGNPKKISYIERETPVERDDTPVESGEDDDLIATVVEVSQVKEDGEKPPPIRVRVCV